MKILISIDDGGGKRGEKEFKFEIYNELTLTIKKKKKKRNRLLYKRVYLQKKSEKKFFEFNLRNLFEAAVSLFQCLLFTIP